MSASTTPSFDKLNSTNYNTWSGDMEAWYRAQGLWRLVSGASKCPTVSTPPKDGEEDKVEAWETKADKAAGIMWLMVDSNQRVHFRNIKDDPVKMWKALEDVHMQKRASTRFNAYNDLFSIRKRDEEDLQSLINRIDDAIHRIHDLRPSNFTLDMLDDELASMMLIRALPEEYNTFVSSLLLKDNLDKTAVQNVFIHEDIQRRRRQEDSPSVGGALATSSTNCDFCGGPGHSQPDCKQYARAKEQLVKNRIKWANKQKSKAEAQNKPSASQATEFAGTASALSTSSSPTPPNFDWLADTGATSHMTPHRHWVRNYSHLCIPIRLADNSIIYSAGVGTVVFNPVIDGKASQSVEFTRVLHVPLLQKNLLACLYLTKHKEFKIQIDSQRMDFIRHGQTLFCAPIDSDNSASLSGSTEPLPESTNWASTLPLSISLWHRRCCHHNVPDITKMHKDNLVTGMTITSSEKPDVVCEPCLAGKMHSNPFPTSPSRSIQPLELVHSDLHGPLPVATREGYRYWITFIDDATSYRAAMKLKRKSDALEAFQTFKAFAENQLNAKIKALQDDKGGEYMSKAFIKFTNDCGIHRRHTTRNRPQQNGVAERANRTMADDISAMLYEAQLPPSLWGEALATQIHVWNRLPTSSLKGKTPFEAWFNRKPDISHLRVWGCLAYVFVQKDKRRGLESHMEKCVFMGYPAGYKGWTFYNPATKKYFISERAEFDERVFPGLSNYKATSPVNLRPTGSTPQPSVPSPDPVFNLGGDSDEVDNPTHSVHAPVHPVQPALVPDSPPPAPPVDFPPDHPPTPPRRTTRISRPPGEWWKVRHPAPPEAEPPVLWSDDEVDEVEEDDVDDGQQANFASQSTPHTFKQAMNGPQSDYWREAATLEYNTLVENGTWEIVDLPKDQKAIGSGWVFKVKHHSDGSIERYKARIVAKGYSQRPGLDYNESFAPTFRPATLRIIIALAAVEDLELRSVDITSAFTNGDLDEVIYMKQPEGFEIGGPDKVCRLLKSLYGLKQSARQWNKKLHSVLTELGFKRIESDRSVYIYSNGEVRIIVPIYIDDITLASKSPAAIDKYVHLLSQHFKCRDLGPTRFLLGVAVERDRSTRTIKLHQGQFILDLLEKYGMSDCKPVLTPLPPKLALSHDMSPCTEEERKLMSEIPYLSAVGSLQYLATMTRPDIAHAVAYLARFNANPGLDHWKALKHLLRYLKGTVDHKLHYRGDLSGKELFITYSDASHGDCVDTGRSTAGYVTMMAGGAVGWYSKLQTIVALSTTEAEYMAAVEAGKEIAWMRNILSEFGYSIQEPSTLKLDNQSAITVSKNPEHHGRMKHLDLQFYWLRDKVEHGSISPDFIPTAEMIADSLTKSLPAPKVRFCREQMGILL